MEILLSWEHHITIKRRLWRCWWKLELIHSWGVKMWDQFPVLPFPFHICRVKQQEIMQEEMVILILKEYWRIMREILKDWEVWDEFDDIKSHNFHLIYQIIMFCFFMMVGWIKISIIWFHLSYFMIWFWDDLGFKNIRRRWRSSIQMENEMWMFWGGISRIWMGRIVGEKDQVLSFDLSFSKSLYYFHDRIHFSISFPVQPTILPSYPSLRMDPCLLSSSWKSTKLSSQILTSFLSSIS